MRIILFIVKELAAFFTIPKRVYQLFVFFLMNPPVLTVSVNIARVLLRGIGVSATPTVICLTCTPIPTAKPAILLRVACTYSCLFSSLYEKSIKTTFLILSSAPIMRWRKNSSEAAAALEVLTVSPSRLFCTAAAGSL